MSPLVALLVAIFVIIVAVAGVWLVLDLLFAPPANARMVRALKAVVVLIGLVVLVERAGWLR